MQVRYYIGFLFLLLCAAAQAQVRFTASASQGQVPTGQQFEVTFSANANVEDFTPPANFNGFQVVGGPNQSQSMSSYNGSTTVSVGFSYVLVPTKVGTFTIGPASVIVNGKKYTTAPLTIKVTKGAPVQQQQQQGNQAQGGNIPKAGGDISKSVFIRAVLSKPSVYQGEQLTLTYKLYTQVRILDNRVDKTPELNGFWNEDLTQKIDPQKVGTEIYKGRMYNVFDIKQTLLYPDHAGDIKIDPFVMTFVVEQRVATGDIWDMFGGNTEQVQYQAKSNTLTVHVKPLPDAGKPAGFGGAVGNFSASVSLDKKELKANEPLNYKVLIKGSGNFKLLNPPVVTFPPDFEKYDPKLVDSTQISAAGANGHQVYTYLVIPRHEGDYTIEPLQFSYFNPTTGRYQTVATQSFNVKVNKGDKQAGLTYSSDQQDIKQLGKDIRYIKTDENVLDEASGFFGSGLYCFLLLIGPLAFGGAWFYRRWSIKYNADVVKVKSRRASKVAAKHLSNAQKQLAANNMQQFYEAVSRGLYGYLSDKLNIPAADLNTENITAGLESRGAKHDVVVQLTDTLDMCAMARYAPVTGIAPQQVFEKAKAIIDEIEAEI